MTTDPVDRNVPGVDTAFSFIRQQWKVVVACTALVAAAALGLAVQRSAEYTATASLLLRATPSGTADAGAASSSPADPDRDVKTGLALLNMEAVASRTAARLHKDVAIGDNVVAQQKVDTNVVVITATAPQARAAAQVADTFAREFIAFRRETDTRAIANQRALVDVEIRRLRAQARSPETNLQLRALQQRSDGLGVQSSLQTGNAELVQGAAIPRRSDAPSASRTGALAAALGLIVGIGVGLVRATTDRRLRDPAELERLFATSLVGAIPRRRLIGGRRPHPTRLAEHERDAFRMVWANLRFAGGDRWLSTVVVSSREPRDGRSTVAWGLATAAAQEGERVLLVETDFERPAFAGRDVASGPGLHEVLSGDVKLADGIHAAGAFEVMAPGLPHSRTVPDSARLGEFMREITSVYDLVVIDTPPSSLPDVMPFIKLADCVLAVGRINHSQREALQRVDTQLRQLDAAAVGVVANAVGRRDASRYGAPRRGGGTRRPQAAGVRVSAPPLVAPAPPRPRTAGPDHDPETPQPDGQAEAAKRVPAPKA